MIAFLGRNFDKLPEYPGIGVHDQLKDKTVIDLLIIIGGPDRIVQSAREIHHEM